MLQPPNKVRSSPDPDGGSLANQHHQSTCDGEQRHSGEVKQHLRFGNTGESHVLRSFRRRTSTADCFSNVSLSHGRGAYRKFVVARSQIPPRRFAHA